MRVGDMVVEKAFKIMKRTVFVGLIVHEGK